MCVCIHVCMCVRVCVCVYSAFMLTVLNTMGSWLLTTCSCLPTQGESGGAQDDLENARDAGAGAMVQLVYAASLAATALFVGVERRHLMVLIVLLFLPLFFIYFTTALFVGVERRHLMVLIFCFLFFVF